MFLNFSSAAEFPVCVVVCHSTLRFWGENQKSLTGMKGMRDAKMQLIVFFFNTEYFHIYCSCHVKAAALSQTQDQWDFCTQSGSCKINT